MVKLVFLFIILTNCLFAQADSTDEWASSHGWIKVSSDTTNAGVVETVYIEKSPGTGESFYKFDPHVSKDSIFFRGGIEDKTGTINNYSKIDSLIGENLGIKYLDLFTQDLKKLPENIRHLENLEVLIVGSNNFSELPDWFDELPKLREINLSYLEKLDFDEAFHRLAKCPALERLEIYSCGIEELPCSISELGNLKYLDLSGNDFVFLPECITELDSLSEIHLNNSENIDLFRMVEVLNKMNGLSKVWLFDNGITDAVASMLWYLKPQYEIRYLEFWEE